MEDLFKRSIHWNKKTRERVKRWDKWADVCRYLKGYAVMDVKTAESHVYTIRIPVE